MTNKELDVACKAHGLLTVNEQLAPGPMDYFWGHNAVHSLQALDTWCGMERGTYLRLKMRHDVGDIQLTDTQYDEILAKLVMLHSFHANVRQVMNAV